MLLRTMLMAGLVSASSTAGAQTFTKVTPQKMPPLAAPRSRPALPAHIRLTPPQRNLAIQQLTGNPIAAATSQTIRLSIDQPTPDASLGFRKVDAIDQDTSWVLLQSDGQVTFSLASLGGKTMQGLWLFECSVGAKSLTWQGYAKDFKTTDGTLGAVIPVTQTNAVFVIDFRSLEDSVITLSNPQKQPWIYGGCNATLLK